MRDTTKDRDQDGAIPGRRDLDKTDAGTTRPEQDQDTGVPPAGPDAPRTRVTGAPAPDDMPGRSRVSGGFTPDKTESAREDEGTPADRPGHRAGGASPIR